MQRPPAGRIVSIASAEYPGSLRTIPSAPQTLYIRGPRESEERRLARDRIQSGLSIATVVVQTDTLGGSMETAFACLSQGRLLCAITPPSAGAVGWEGNEFLISGQPEEVETGPPRLRRFKRFAAAGARLAVPVHASSVKADLAVIRDRAW
jgi:predicted Rossmann fold nucleotide-binding protein DprA/Smf involved in DNA uptake